jgi:hypothetical protein
LFGKKGNKKLSYESFLHFLRSLQDDVLRLEFESFSPDRRDTIRSIQTPRASHARAHKPQLLNSFRNFAEALISSARTLNPKP